jgi:hypothetical protein
VSSDSIVDFEERMLLREETASQTATVSLDRVAGASDDDLLYYIDHNIHGQRKKQYEYEHHTL